MGEGQHGLAERRLRGRSLSRVHSRASIIGSPEISPTNAAQVLEEADRCMANCPKALLAHFYKSKALLMLGRTDEALATSREVLKKDPNNVLAYADMGLVYAATNQRDK